MTDTIETAAAVTTFRNFIAGEWCDSTSGETFESRNPADQRDVIGRFQQGTKADVAMAVTNQASDVSAARRVRPSVDAAETGPVPAEAQNLPEDTGLVARLIRSPLAWLTVLTLVVSFVAAWDLIGGGYFGSTYLPREKQVDLKAPLPDRIFTPESLSGEGVR